MTRRRSWLTIAGIIVASSLVLGSRTLEAATDPVLERVGAESKQWLRSHYKDRDYKAIVVDQATRTSTGSEVKGWIIWREGCPREQRWHFIFDHDGVLDGKRSIVDYLDGAQRCYETSTGRPAPLSTLETDAFLRQAHMTCTAAVRRPVAVPDVRVWTEEVQRFEDGGVNLRGFLETATQNFGWVCKVGPDGKIRSSGKDVMLLPRGRVGSAR